MNDIDRSNRKQQPATRVDPITGAVIQGALENIAIEMGHKLMRMSYSSIIRGWNRDGKANPAKAGAACILRRAGHAPARAVRHAPARERLFRTRACFPLAACP